eukprot:2455725-Rhodomonas_salina.3
MSVFQTSSTRDNASPGYRNGHETLCPSEKSNRERDAASVTESWTSRSERNAVTDTEYDTVADKGKTSYLSAPVRAPFRLLSDA